MQKGAFSIFCGFNLAVVILLSFSPVPALRLSPGSSKAGDTRAEQHDEEVSFFQL